MNKLYKHQDSFISRNPRKALLNWEMRTGKSLPAAIWIDMPERAGNTFIITPKQNKKEWERYNTKATVLSKEELKKTKITNPTAIVVDEIHYFASPLFLKERSQLATKLYELVKEYSTMYILGLSATPVRQDAWSLHTLLCYVGVYYDWRGWRDTFFEMKRMPYLRFPAYFPKKDWRLKIRPFIEKHTDIVALKDVVEDLPPAETHIIEVETLEDADDNCPCGNYRWWRCLYSIHDRQ